MTNVSTENICGVWRGFGPDGQTRESWSIRGVKVDGRFFGETILTSGSRKNEVIWVHGTLSRTETDEFHRIVAEIAEYAINERTHDDGDFDGHLAQGFMSDFKTICYYSRGKHRGTKFGEKFERIIDLLAVYFRDP